MSRMWGAARGVEAIKLVRSPVGLVATLALVGGVLVLVGGLTAGVRTGNEAVIDQLGPGPHLQWSGMVAIAMQITAAGGLIGCGVVLTWMIGREFSDGTIAALFALPVSLGRIALTKLGVYGLWVMAVHVVLTTGLLGLGLLLGYGTPGVEEWGHLARQTALGLCTGALAVPVAWVTTVTRSVLAGVGATIGLVVLAQVGALSGAGGWFPPSAPALWALDAAGTIPETGVRWPHLLLVAVVPAVFAVLVQRSWSRLQMDR